MLFTEQTDKSFVNQTGATLAFPVDMQEGMKTNRKHSFDQIGGNTTVMGLS